MNRLSQESSPYLLQHSENPVHWYPWGDDAFAEACSRDVPIFLSIGYATCHWCHVMEHESFEDEEVASLLNEGFVSIKVDREERPDVDHVYMSVCQIMGSSCGWPLTVIMTPGMKPFFVATYIPKHGRFGRIGMMDLLPRITQAWTQDRKRVEDSAESVTSALQSLDTAMAGSGEVDSSWLQTAFDQLSDRFDPARGGFGGAPKFPAPHNLLFLLRYWYRRRDPVALDMVARTLRSMRRGGIFDHVGYGFHRYSTDREWKLPHFEKMLYDQALHIMAYTEAFLAAGDPSFAEVAREVAEYVLRDLTSRDGGFFSAEDADSEGEEGKFYVWSVEEIREVLPPDLADLVTDTFELAPEGNFLDEATRELAGVNVLHGPTGDELESSGRVLPEEARELLFRRREGRERPLLDDKILTDWNGLMIAALSRLGAAVGDTGYIDAAVRAADFVIGKLRDREGRLLHRYRADTAGIGGHLPDYAFLAWGLIELYQATYDVRYLVHAVETATQMISRFYDDDHGGFFMTASDGEVLVARLKDYDDGAMPSGNSVALLCLVRLARLTGRTDFEEVAARLLESAAPRVDRYPSGYTGLLMGLEFIEAGATEVVIAGPRGDDSVQRMVAALRECYLPSTVSLVVGDESAELARVSPFTKAFPRDSGDARAYVCRDHVCSEPSATVDEMMTALGVARENLNGLKRSPDSGG